MDGQILCPHCNKAIPLTEAISHQMREQREREREEEKKKWTAMFHKRLDEERLKMEQEKSQLKTKIEDQIKQKIYKEHELQIQDAKNEREELQKQNKGLQEQLLETNKLLRQLRTENEQKQLEFDKKLTVEQDKIRSDIQRRADEEYRLKMLEKDKKIQDAMKMVEDYKRKLEQGSQQTQGEVLELEIENFLKTHFPTDEITPVPKGIRGADLIQIVKNSYGRPCGSIIWETKRTKSWSNEWIPKLKEDQRQVRAELAILVTQALPAEIKYFGAIEGVWVAEYGCISGLAVALRSKLIEVEALRTSSVGKNEKMELLYTYLSGTEFKQRVEAIIECFRAMEDDLKKERTWFMAKWARQEKNITKVIDNTFGMHGDLQSIMGKALAQVDGAELLPPDSSNGKGTLVDSDATLF